MVAMKNEPKSETVSNTFRLGFQLNEKFREFTESAGLSQQRVLEALVYRLVVESSPPLSELPQIMREAAGWNKGMARPTASEPKGDEAKAARSALDAKLQHSQPATRKLPERKTQGQ